MKLVKSKDNEHLVKDIKKDFHSDEGIITSESLQNQTTCTTNTNIEFSIINPEFIDKWKRLQRKAQVPLLKDIGAILAHTGVSKEWIVVDAGTGSGGIALFLANIVKKVVTYDKREDHSKTAQKNADFLNIKNIEFKIKDIEEGIDETNVDLFTLDVPEPWKCIEALQSVKQGGFIISYSPQLTQSQHLINQLDKSFQVEKTIELIEREWIINNKQMKPFVHSPHSGFLTFIRKIS